MESLRIVPVNFVVADGSIVFRTTPYSELGTYGWRCDLTFETDQLDHATRSGWSVLAVGRAEMCLADFITYGLTDEEYRAIGDLPRGHGHPPRDRHQPDG
jgi:hypothetical protein